MNPQRIAKFMAAAGLCSRREAESWIALGRVAVNGVVLTSPAVVVSAADVVMVDGRRITLTAELPRLFLYHKPAGLVTTHKDERGRETVFQHLPKSLPRVVSIGRLDLDSEGLLLLTNSGALARAMELPRNALVRSYRVRVKGTPTTAQLTELAQGVSVEGMHYQPIEVEADAEKLGRNQWLSVTLHEGKNREIRRVFAHFDLPVSRLIRVQYGPFTLGALQPGEVREVPSPMVERVMERLAVSGE